jgi:hypothetical protein
MSIRRARIAGLRQTRQPNRKGSLCLCSGGRQKTRSLRNRTLPCYLPIKPKGATRGKMRNQSLKLSPHAHNPNPNPLQKACLVTQRSQSRNYIIYSAPIYRTICGVVKSAPLKYASKRCDLLPTCLLCGTSRGSYSCRVRKATAQIAHAQRQRHTIQSDLWLR